MFSSMIRRARRQSLTRNITTTSDPFAMRNIALTAHIDSGKTTLTESILHASSYLKTPGSVDTGSTTTDFLPAERERGITIQSASIPVNWKHWVFNLVDTPGHADFGMEVESASSVVDGAVVLLDGVEGVEAQTTGVWRQLDRHSVPTRLIFINKLDRPGASFRDSILSLLSNKLHPIPIVLTLPIASFDPRQYQRGEPGIQGIVDLIKWEIWKWDTPDPKPQRLLLPRTEAELRETTLLPPFHPLINHLLPARTQLIDCLSHFSPELLDHLLLDESESPYLALSPAVILPPLRKLTLQKEILPILCGSALQHVGTEILMDYIGELLASPLDILLSPNSPMSSPYVEIMAWKVTWDKKKGWMTFIRIYSGTLTRQSTLLNTKTGQRERVSKLLLLYASQPEEVESLTFGSIGVILGLKHTRTGDTLVSCSSGIHEEPVTTLNSITAPPAVVSASIIPQTHSDLAPVQEALQALSRTDPSVRITEEEGQTLVSGLGALHLEIVEGRLKDEWGVHCQFGKRRVSYREGLGQTNCLPVHEVWNKDLGGKVASASVDLEVRMLDQLEEGNEEWGGNIVMVDDNPVPPPESLPRQTPHSLLSPLLQGLQSSLAVSPHSLLPLSRLHINVKSYSLGPNSPPTAMIAASAAALRRAVHNSGEGPIMEPFVKVKVDVAEGVMGKVVKDLTENGGEILDLSAGDLSLSLNAEWNTNPFPITNLYVPPSWLTPCALTQVTPSGPQVKRTVYAVAPLAKMLDYSNRLRAISGGQAVFEMNNEGFRAVEEPRRLEILREIGRA